jgi:hypothetical protein
MVTEINRKIAYKRIRPGSQVNDQDTGGGIKIPVITEITFKDPTDRGQEATYTIDNTYTGWRDVHYAWVGPKGSPNAKESGVVLTDEVPGDCVLVERDNELRFKDAVDRGQQTFPALDNSPESYDPHGPPYFKQHLKTHVVKYWNDPTDQNSGTAAEVELIDELLVKDPVEKGQETHYFLQNPQDDAAANAQLLDQDGNPRADLQDITRTDVEVGEVDPPYRFDPFQNLIHVNGYYVMFVWVWSDWTYDGFSDVLIINPGGSQFLPETWSLIPGEDGYGFRSSVTLDMIGDSGEHLSDVGPVNKKDDATQRITGQFDISHPIFGCMPPPGFGFFNSGGWGYAPACPIGVDPSLQHIETSGTTYPAYVYFSTWLFLCSATTPPADDATDDQKANYKPMTFRMKTKNMKYQIEEVTYGAPFTDLSGDPVPRIHYLKQLPFIDEAFVFRIVAMVFKADDVDLTLDDKIHPIKKKGDTRNYQQSPYDGQFQNDYYDWSTTLMHAAQSTTGINFNVYDDPGPPPDPVQQQTNYFKTGWNTLNTVPSEWRFEMRKLDNVVPDNKDKPWPIVWPVTPAAFLNPNPPDDPQHPEQFKYINTYYYTTIDKDGLYDPFRIGQTIPVGFFTTPFKFGTPPEGGGGPETII